MSPSETDHILNTLIQHSQTYLGKNTGYPEILSSASTYLQAITNNFNKINEILEKKMCPNVYNYIS